MSTALKFGMIAAGLSCLGIVGPALAQQQTIREQTKPAQYADQDTGQPLQEQMRDSNRPASGERSTTYFRGPDAAGEASQNASGAVDQYLANCLSIKNQGEIEMNEFALEKTKNDEVKQFARQMIEDHKQLDQRLSKLTGTTTGQAQVQNAALNRLLQIDRQIADECQSMAQNKLSDKSGTEFDKCFINAQIGAHMAMLSALTVISDESGGQLQQVASDAKTKVEQHLQHAEKLAKQLESSNRG